jgi:AbiV family abortive infection protein
MNDVDKITPVVQACLSNAELLLSAAKSARRPSHNHIVYHLATMALEEIGKASMVAVSSLRQAPLPEKEGSDDEKGRPVDWIEDHERKLFWALWMTGFKNQKIAPDDFRQFQDLAKYIHELRVASIYVDPAHLSAQQGVSDLDVDTILSLTEARLNTEKLTSFRQLDEVARSMLEWFFRATDDPQLRTIIFSDRSFAKLADLAGDAKAWLLWLREVVDEISRTNQELAERELRRVQPDGAEGNEPKWQIKIRLSTWSHSIKPKPLAWWNKTVVWIKLFPTRDKKELLVQITLPKKMPVQAVWSGGIQMSSMFVISLNIGTLGFFWWYMPTFVSKYYEEIVDIENNASILLERSPQLLISWGHLALKESQLSNVGSVLAHLIGRTPTQMHPYDRYFRALGLLAKNDIFGQFECMVMIEFYEAFKAGLIAYGDWDGTLSTFEESSAKVSREMKADSQLFSDMKEILQLAAEVVNHRKLNSTVTLKEVITMKICCDLYFLNRASQGIRQRHEGGART